MLQEKRFTVAYESYGSQKSRSPDYTITFKSITFNVEVTRIDSSSMEMSGTPPGLITEQVNGRLMDTVCDKLGQIQNLTTYYPSLYYVRIYI